MHSAFIVEKSSIITRVSREIMTITVIGLRKANIIIMVIKIFRMFRVVVATIISCIRIVGVIRIIQVIRAAPNKCFHSFIKRGIKPTRLVE